jgi:hypothetical protein
MDKKFKIVTVFILYSVLLYWVTNFLIQKQINENARQGGVIDQLTQGAFYIVTGVSIYFVTINLTAIIGLIIFWRRNDKIGLTTFKFLTTLTLIGTLIFYLIN